MVRGIPQGSVLGPLLWNMAYDAMLGTYQSHGVTIIGYADKHSLEIPECGSRQQVRDSSPLSPAVLTSEKHGGSTEPTPIQLERSERPRRLYSGIASMSSTAHLYGRRR